MKKPQLIQLKYGQRDWIDIFTKEHTKMANRYKNKMVNITDHQGISNQNRNEINLTPVRMAVIKKTTISFKKYIKGNPCALLVEVETGVVTVEISMWSPKKT